MPAIESETRRESLRPGFTYASTEAFVSLRHERRRSDRIEFGVSWREGDGRLYRAVWFERTGELIAEAIAGRPRVEFLGTVLERENLEFALRGWELLPSDQLTLEWIRTQVSIWAPGAGVAERLHLPWESDDGVTGGRDRVPGVGLVNICAMALASLPPGTAHAEHQERCA